MILPLSCHALVQCSAPHLAATAANPHRLHPELVANGWAWFLDRYAYPWARAGYHVWVAWPSGCLPVDKPRILGTNREGTPIPMVLRRARDGDWHEPVRDLLQVVTGQGKRLTLYLAPPSGMADIENLPCTDVAWDARTSVARSPTSGEDVWTRRMIELEKGVCDEPAPLNDPVYDPWSRGRTAFVTTLGLLQKRDPRRHSPTNSVGRAREWFCWIDGSAGTPEQRLQHADGWAMQGYTPVVEPYGFEVAQ